MTEREAFRIVQPLLEGYTEGIYWDFKKGLTDEHIPTIIKDILAFSNSDYNGDSYITLEWEKVKMKPSEKYRFQQRIDED